MTPLTRKTLQGVWGTVLLPLGEDEAIDFPALEEEIDTLLAAGIHGIYSNGSAGEFYAQSMDEYLAINSRLAERCRKAEVPFQVGACHPCAQESLQRVREAKFLAPGAFQVILPDWLPTDEADAITFLDRICEEAAPHGVVLYNPPHAKRLLPPNEFGRLAARFPSLLGIKVAGGDASWFSAMKEHCGDLAYFIPGHTYVSGRRQGAHGSYSNVACLQPERAIAWHSLMEADSEKALRIEQSLQAFIRSRILPYYEQGYCSAALDKLLAHIGGWASVGTRLRWPYRGVASNEANALRDMAQTELAEFFAL